MPAHVAQNALDHDRLSFSTKQGKSLEGPS